jgi:acyl carrier protein phosphodiesterase
MNHLAHLFLASPGSDSLLGNLCGDFVKGSIDGRFSEGVRRGIAQHRHIDEFTDTHPAVTAFRRVIAAEHGHYARVIADIFFDHFLVATWSDWSDETLEEFLHRVWTTLDPRQEEMPERLRRIYPRMRDDGWLQSYGTFDGVWTALYWISRRFSREPRLEFAAPLLIHERKELEHRFRQFFPEVIDYARSVFSNPSRR